MNYEEIMIECSFEALEEMRPFSSTETRQVRYHGKDKKVMKMMLDQLTVLVQSYVKTNS